MIDITENKLKQWARIGMRATFGLLCSELIGNKNEIYIFTSDVSTSAGLDRFRKNHENKNAKLVFIGEGKNVKKAKELVEELNISEFVAFKGKLNQSEIIEELDVADVFVHHSITSKKGDQEGIPNALVEAMAMEMPVLTTFHSGIPELVNHGVNGFLCEENDVLTYSEQMDQIYNWGYRKENRDLIEKKFSLKKHVDKLNEMYDHIKRNDWRKF